MRNFLIALLGLLLWSPLKAQELPAEEIFQVVEEMPRFPGCEDLTDIKERKQCASKKLLGFIYQYIQYPDSARMEGLEGTVVVQFVVTATGEIAKSVILRDIGGGCGEEALRVINLMKQLPEKWIPGKFDGKAVSVYYNLPIKFKLEEAEQPLEYILIGADTIWTVTDTPIEFTGEEGESLEDYIQTSLYYPQEGLAECKIGEIDVEVLVAADGRILLLDMADYSGLDIDFQYEAVAWVNSSKDKWKPATREGRAVHSSFWQRLVFAPDTEECKDRISDYESAKQMILDGLEMAADTSQIETAFAKWDAAIELFPNNTEMLAVRGQAYMQQGDFDKACEDIKKASKIMWSDWLNSLLGVLCK